MRGVLVMNEACRRIKEIDARTWTIADERAAAKVVLAFNRFASEKGVSTEAAALLTLAWCDQMKDQSLDAYDRRPFDAQ